MVDRVELGSALGAGSAAWRARPRAAHVVVDPAVLPALNVGVRLALVALLAVVTACAAHMVDRVELGSALGAGSAAWRARPRAAHVVKLARELPERWFGVAPRRAGAGRQDARRLSDGGTRSAVAGSASELAPAHGGRARRRAREIVQRCWRRGTVGDAREEGGGWAAGDGAAGGNR